MEKMSLDATRSDIHLGLCGKVRVGRVNERKYLILLWFGDIQTLQQVCTLTFRLQHSFLTNERNHLCDVIKTKYTLLEELFV